METCYHCGDKVYEKSAHQYNDKLFCCSGCVTVYQLFTENNLDQFYTFEANAGNKPKTSNQSKYAFLDIDSIRSKYIEFSDRKTEQITLFLPGIHCSSCIYLLENINKLNKAILTCQVNFTEREATIAYKKDELKLSELALLLDQIGYAPNFESKQHRQKKLDRTFLYKLGIAGFAFGSIMLWTVPEYLGIEEDNPEFRSFMAYLSLIVSIPVLFYSANDYLISAFKAIRYKALNLDVPIAIGILALYSQSVYSILSGLGTGYMDSFAGFIFFLLIGKWFQSKSYRSLSFERDYTAYFPVAVLKVNPNEEEELVELEKLKVDDTILVRNEEIIPCDAEVLSESISLDYSFVSGESEIITKKKGDFIYAGGKMIGQQGRLKVMAESNRSHLTSLWNKNNSEEKTTTSDKLSIWFIISLLIIATLAAVVWYLIDPSRIIEIVVAVLIVACPCALALSRPFTYGNGMRLLGRKGFYLKNSEILPKLNEVNTLIFDKTGTLTSLSGSTNYIGELLNNDIWSTVYSMTKSSIHPYSNRIANYIVDLNKNTEIPLDNFEEIKGKGIQATYDGNTYRLGSAQFVQSKDQDPGVYLSINNTVVGKFIFESSSREGIEEMLKGLSNYETFILSGDSEKDLDLMTSLGVPAKNCFFHQTPGDKKAFVASQKALGKKVAMIGDGLNDVGALNEADLGIAVTEDVFQFSPSSDAILATSELKSLPYFLSISAFSKKVLATCFIFSILYNILGLSFALSGQLSPLVAAILMPISSISIVFIATIGTQFFSPKLKV